MAQTSGSITLDTDALSASLSAGVTRGLVPVLEHLDQLLSSLHASHHVSAPLSDQQARDVLINAFGRIYPDTGTVAVETIAETLRSLLQEHGYALVSIVPGKEFTPLADKAQEVAQEMDEAAKRGPGVWFD